ncbi:MAG: dipeptidase [Proteobacteria bacterium]|nr:dipeptidase [Pseudomonadota bacterium]
MNQARRLHQEAIIIDNTCPLAALDDFHDNYARGGVTAIAATVGYGMANIGTLDFTMKNLGKWFNKFRDEKQNLIHITCVEDIFKAKIQGKLGVIFHFQGTTPFENDINTVELFHRLGVRVCQLCYNSKDLVGCGCAVEPDTGLTPFGEKVINEMNRLGMVIDCAHTGKKTTMYAIAASKSPVIISHGNSRAVCNNLRNCDDDLLKAISKNGGVIGFNGFPGFVADKPRPTLEDLLDHVDHMAQIAGPENICVGMDYFEYQAGVTDDETAAQVYNFLIDSGSWSPQEYPAPPWFWPTGIELPEKLSNLTPGLLSRGFSEDEVKGILGLNIVRIFKEVWK